MLGGQQGHVHAPEVRSMIVKEKGATLGNRYLKLLCATQQWFLF
ncbi:hypothetical protein DO72_5722 [Burkholderia pseudomallei]|nr:hypothetical protein DO70_5295 [Burkholderia pseudomallei]KGD43930.1 hypothetical protein DO72_5722 [Burkholderia pseudomallei]